MGPCRSDLVCAMVVEIEVIFAGNYARLFRLPVE